MLEARGRLGGRASTFVDPVTGEAVDNGQHIVLGCYRETFAYLREIGAAANVRLQPALEVPIVDRDGRSSVLRCPHLLPPLHLLAGILGWEALSWRDRLGVLRLLPAIARARRAGRPPGGAGLQPCHGLVHSHETVGAWLERHGQGPALRELLWDPLTVAALNQPAEVAAAGPFVTVLALMFGSQASDAAIGFPTRPLDQAFAEPARRYLEARGGKVRLNALSRIRIEGCRVAVVDVRGESVDASSVVSAVPWFGLPKVLVGDVAPLAEVVEPARRMSSSPIVTVNLWFDRPVIDTAFVGLPGRTLQWVFDRRQIVGGATSHLSLVSSGAADSLRKTSDALVTLALDEVGAALPRVRGARLVRSLVVREPQATFSLAPGQPRRPSCQTPVPGLVLAGDWIDTGLPATVEGAIASGRMAADALGAA